MEYKSITVGELKEAIKELDNNLTIEIERSFIGNIEVEFIKELKESGKEYYKIKI